MVAIMFVHLRCHSHYSFLRGVNPPEEIIAAAVEQKMPAVALTDTNGMYAAVPFYQAAEKAGVKPIIGVVLEVGAGRSLEKVSRHSDRTQTVRPPVAADATDGECENNSGGVAGDGCGGIQQFVPVDDAAASWRVAIGPGDICGRGGGSGDGGGVGGA